MKKMYRFVFLLCLTLGGILSGTVNAKAQWVVADPTNFLGNLINSGVEVAKAVEQFGVAKEQYDHLKKIYEQVSPYVRTYYKGKEALEIVNDIRHLGGNIIIAQGGEKYLTSAEKIYIIRMQTFYLQQAGKELSKIEGIFNKGGVLSSANSDTDRLSVMNDAFDTLVAYRAVLSNLSNRVKSVTYSRRQADISRDFLTQLRGF